METIMARPEYDLLVKRGRVVMDGTVGVVDIGVGGGRIVALGEDLGGGAAETIDAKGLVVLPGGVDSHCHIEQVSAGGLMNADTFESATAAAALGGTTTVISFAAQHVGLKLDAVLADYEAHARRGAIIDYCFHMIIADPTPECLGEHLPAAIAAGHASIKAFMTYDKIRLHDEQLLDVLMLARRHRALVCVHAENHGMIAWMAKRLVDRGYTAPKFHAPSHPRQSEVEAIGRLVAMSRFLDVPIMVFHISTAEGAAVIARARAEGVRIHAETCPQYLFLTADDLDKPGLEGAKWMCSPPPRAKADQAALWAALERGEIQMVTSDHAPYAFDGTGKLSAGPNPNFKQIANGLPGLTQRVPLLFDVLARRGEEGLVQLARITAAEPARHYNLPMKGVIAIGRDADLAIWDPVRRVTLSDAGVVDGTRFTPYAGRVVKGWPGIVVRRGEIVARGGQVLARPGSGRWLHRPDGGWAARPTGRTAPEFDPRRNFGADMG
jgi:dihydropyrimidinase